MMIDKDKDRATAKGLEAALALFIFSIIYFLIGISALYNSDVNGYLFCIVFTIVLVALSVACAASPDTFGAFIWYIITSPQP
jgi:uncharacterized membrane protein